MSQPLPFTEAEIESSLVARWQRVVAHFPTAIAVSTLSGERYTYQALDQRSNALAQALVAALGPDNQPVILLLGHSLSMLTAILATLKANKAYVAFDPTQATGQLQLLYNATAAALMVTDQAHYALAQEIATAHEQIWLLEALPTTAPDCPNLAITPDAMAGIFFTSGTINRPKGVPRSHRTILHRIWFGTNLCHFAPGACISGIRQCGLGGGVADVFNALLNGATYCIYPLQTHGLQELSAWLQREQITYFHPPIVLFRQWLDTLTPTASFPHLRQILPSGRKHSTDLARLWPHVADACVVLTSYSATETTEITCTVLDRFTPTEAGILHVGQPLPGKQVLVLRDDGQPATAGEVGEIVVRSRYISAGYWRQPALTAQRFRHAADGSGEICYFTGDLGRQRSDGYVELVGRRDAQVKLRGYRIVLSEVEDALQTLPMVKAAAVTADEERGLLLAYLVAATEPPTAPATIRTALLATFPAYALPTHIIYLPALPLLASGKIDRQALPPPPQHRPEGATPYTPPRTALEATLVAIWEEVLAVQPVGTTDHFLDLGGNSMRAMRLLMEIERALGQKASLVDFFNQPTIAHLARSLTSDTADTAGEPAPSAPRTADSPVHRLTPAQEQTLQTLYTQIGQAGVSQTWRKPHQAGWHRRRKAIHDALGVLPYRLSTCLLAKFVQLAWVQRRFYGKQVNALQQFFGECKGQVPDAQTIAHYLFCGCIHHYRLGPWGSRPEAQAAPYAADWVQIHGMELVEQALAQKQGVILLRSHSNGAFFFNTLPLTTYRVGQLQRHLPEWLVHDAVMTSALFAQMLNRARQVLETGGIVDISADGWHGVGRGVDYAFHGRHHAFYTSFAELAILTDAAVIAVTEEIARNGQVTLTFVGPFATGAAEEAQTTRIERLVTAYVAFCTASWADRPWLIPWYQLERHLAYPSVDTPPKDGR